MAGGYPAGLTGRIPKSCHRGIDSEPRHEVPTHAGALFRGSRQAVGERRQELVLAWLRGDQRNALSAERLPGKDLCGDSQRRAWIIKLQSLAVAAPFVAHASGACLAA